MSAQFLKTQAELIQHTQALLCSLFEQNDYQAAQEIAKLLNDLTGSYAHLKEATANQKPQFTSGKAVGGAAFSAASQFRQIQQQKPQPSSYKWADNFEGVTLPKNEQQDLPMQDAWE